MGYLQPSKYPHGGGSGLVCPQGGLGAHRGTWALFLKDLPFREMTMEYTNTNLITDSWI